MRRISPCVGTWSADILLSLYRYLSLIPYSWQMSCMLWFTYTMWMG